MKRKLGLGALLAAAAIMAAVLAYRALYLPELIAIDPAASRPNQAVTLFGRNLGNRQGSILLDEVPLPSSAVVDWSSRLITFRMPHGIDSSAVRIKTSFGKSNALMLANAAKVPVPYGQSTAFLVQPLIASVKPAGNAAVGSKVSIEGERFGEPDEGSELCITRTYVAGLPDQSDAANFVHVPASDSLIERWDEHAIVFRVPDTAESGFVFVRTPHGVSNLYPLKIVRAGGQLLRADSIQYSLEQRISVHVSASLPEGRLSLFVPLPMSSLHERAANALVLGKELLNAEGPGWMEFLLGEKEARRGKIEILVRSSIEVSEMKAELRLGSLQEIAQPAPAFLASSLTSDALVPVDNPSIAASAASIRKKERNPYYQIVRASQWLASTIRIQNALPLAEDNAASALKTGKGSARGAVLAFTALLRALGIPAVPVSGFLVLEDGTTQPHFWVEYYLMGLGWVPMDPLLAQGYRPPRFKADFADPAHYLRGIDRKHVGISRGSVVLPAFSPEVGKKLKAAWSLLPFDEAAAGISASVIRETPKLSVLAY